MDRIMENPGKHGAAPYRVAVIHGGPGAAGEMEPVARVLAAEQSILEPLQTERSVDGQVRELRRILNRHGKLPITLIGFSWGAWLGFLLAARHPGMVKKLILVGSGGFEAKHGRRTLYTRLSRLCEADRETAENLMRQLQEIDSAHRRSPVFAKLGELFRKADAFDPLPVPAGQAASVELNVDIHQSVWKEANALRRDGGLLESAHRIACPVVAVHGDHDPHPAEGVEKPLSAVLADFRFILLQNCGHVPWLERRARDRFFRILKREIML